MSDSKKLFYGILLFIALDLSILIINYWIANQVANDAVAINLAGRQRMLSQRITKSLLALELDKSDTVKETSIQELRDSALMFDQTLTAFELGGRVVGGDGNAAVLKSVHKGQAATLVNQTQQIWKPTRNLLFPYFTTQENIPSEVISQSQDEMLQNNLQILDSMNRLTSSLQEDSLSRVNTLRIVQTIVFFLALINFLVIVRKFHLLAMQTHQAKEHFSELAVRDPLTGLFNRREFDTNLKREIGAVGRHPEEKLAIVMIDLDEFKPINDKLGHKAGDIVLKTVATRLAKHARTSDTVARIGGDEFALICTSLHDEEGAAKFCDRLLNSINDPIELEAGKVRVGASIGIAFYPNQTNSDLDPMHMADDAMYAAKRDGRNRYTFFRES